MESRDESERRGVDRFGFEEAVFVALRPDFKRLGSLRDISPTGLGFEYFPWGEGDCLLGNIEVDIFSQKNNYLASRIPCRVVYDKPLDAKFVSSPRRCGLQFNELSYREGERLNLLMQNHALRPAPDSGD